MDMEQELRKRLEAVQRRVAAAARRAGRDPAEVQIVAVSKTVPPERVAALARLGIRQFGENRVEEAEAKIPAVRTLLGEDLAHRISWYLVGHLQSRKAARALELFDEVHSVDTVKLAARLDRLAAMQGRRLPVLLEVNISGEATKYGLSASNWPHDRKQAEELYAQIEAILSLPHLNVRGLMTVAPLSTDPEAVRPVFRRLRELRDALAGRWPGHAFPVLSMGMSDDYEVAVEEGATMIRLGRAIFGPRL